MPFDFDQCIEQYRAEAAPESQYPREKSWDYLWDYVRPSTRTRDGRSALVTGRQLELTALHIGFYLASWGMFRGRLLYQNLDFFKALSEHIFMQLNPQFWNVTFTGFGEDSQSVDIFDGARDGVREFLQRELFPAQRDTDLIVGKLLLGVWGQCPALDKFFKDGWTSFRREIGGPADVRCGLTGEFLQKLNILAHDKGWNLRLLRDNGIVYPAGKIIDMAFFQHGKNTQV